MLNDFSQINLIFHCYKVVSYPIHLLIRLIGQSNTTFALTPCQKCQVLTLSHYFCARNDSWLSIKSDILYRVFATGQNNQKRAFNNCVLRQDQVDSVSNKGPLKYNIIGLGGWVQKMTTFSLLLEHRGWTSVVILDTFIQ